MTSYGISYGIQWKILWNILWNPLEYPMEYPMECPMEPSGISYEILRISYGICYGAPMNIL